MAQVQVFGAVADGEEGIAVVVVHVADQQAVVAVGNAFQLKPALVVRHGEGDERGVFFVQHGDGGGGHGLFAKGIEGRAFDAAVLLGRGGNGDGDQE